MKTIICLFFLVTVFLLTGCENMQNLDNAKNELMETDRAFSEMSLAEGYKIAFDKFMADETIIYRNGAFPITGRDAINEVLAKDPDAVLKWEPFFADIAKSRDLGYTLGSYEYIVTDSAGIETSYFGSYVSIWKKQSDGSWKYVFDTGQPSPNPEE
jgi:ketosteroid isomerase-like protein